MLPVCDIVYSSRGWRGLANIFFLFLSCWWYLCGTCNQPAREEYDKICLSTIHRLHMYLNLVYFNVALSFTHSCAVLVDRHAFSHWTLWSPDDDSPSERCSLPLALLLTGWFHWADNSLHLGANELDCIYHSWLTVKLPSVNMLFNSGFCPLSAGCKALRKTSCLVSRSNLV